MVLLPLRGTEGSQPEDSGPLIDRVWNHSGVECQFPYFGGRLWLRASAHIYNVPDDYVRLGKALLELGFGPDQR